MPEEEVVVDQDQTTDQEPVEESEDTIIEGFAAETETPEKTEAPAAAESEPVKEEKAEPSDDGMKTEVESLKRQVHDLNRALHQARKEKPKEETEEPLTDEQIVGLMEQHKDDPRMQLNIIRYAAQQAAKSESDKAVDAQHISKIKDWVAERKLARDPALADENSPASQEVSKIQQNLNLSDHPAGQYLSACVLVAETMEKQLEAAFERGKKAGLGEKAENTRKQTVKETTLSPTRKPTPKKSSGLTSQMATVADQMGLTESQRKLYASFRGQEG